MVVFAQSYGEITREGYQVGIEGRSVAEDRGVAPDITREQDDGWEM